MADRKFDDGRWQYDVFLSFKGDDTRKNFTDHLYHALRDGGINVFRDDNELPRGKHITDELGQAIQRSKIAIIVFSKGYANSRWCLEELVKIMECRRALNQLVLPVFYDVDPSYVRNQKRSFEEAFVRHQLHNNDKNFSWRMALNEAANLAGFNLKNTADGYEGKFIKKIVQKISRDLKRTIDVAHYQVGIDSRVNAITSELDVGLGGVRMIGIWGMGGVGKTTIAKAVYNLLYDNFDGACFLDNIKDTLEQSNGLVLLQEKLLKSIFKSSKIELQNVHEGITQLQQRLPHKKVLLILDDIDDMRSLNALARSRDWFGAGSRIIITTRDEHLLKNLKVDAIYKIDEMNEIEALELFSWHAFHNNCPFKGYYELSKHVVSYCGGLPLALEVLGSFLHGRTIAEWEGAMNKLKKNPHSKIQKQLMISFDDLDDQTKDIFLDISCFFIGMDKNEVTQILDGCGFFPRIGISVLLERCLLKVDHKNKFVMHNLIRAMGREIVHNESSKEPEKRSRLFLNDEVLDVLEKQKGTDVTEGLSLELSISSEKKIHTKAFNAMQKLRLLQLNYARISGDFTNLFSELRWLCWHGFPLESLPKNFYLEKAVAIDLRYSHLIKLFQKEPQFSLEKVTILNLSHSRYLSCTPNFLKLPHLEKLQLEDCKSLVKVDNSIGCLQKLVSINLKDCTCLSKLPETLCELKSLETLILSRCSKLERLPNNLGNMESLKTLAVEGTCIQELPSTIVGLKKLKFLSITRSKGHPSKSVTEILWSWIIFPRKIKNSIVLPTSLRGLESLTELILTNCNLSDDAIPKDIGSLVSLKKLDLGGNDFHTLPSTISCLSNLSNLSLDDCLKLEEISNLPPNLRFISAHKCKALERISGLPQNFLDDIIVQECPKLVEISGFDQMVPYIPYVSMRGCHSKLYQSFKENILQRMFLEINQGIKLRTFPDGAVFQESCWSLYLEPSQIADFDFKRFIYSSFCHRPNLEGITNLYWSDDELPKVEDSGNGITHIIGKTCFELSEVGRSSDRCILIRKHYYDFGYMLEIRCINFNFVSRTWFIESVLQVF